MPAPSPLLCLLHLLHVKGLPIRKRDEPVQLDRESDLSLAVFSNQCRYDDPDLQYRSRGDVGECDGFGLVLGGVGGFSISSTLAE